MVVGYFAARQKEVMNRGYLVLKEFAHVCDFSTSFFEKLEAPSSYSGKTLEKLFKVVYEPFPEEHSLRSEERRVLWNPIFNVGEEVIDLLNRSRGIGKYASTKKLLKNIMADDGSQVCTGRKERSVGRVAGIACNSVEPGRWV